MTAWMTIVLALVGWTANDQINLADFGRVVQYSGDSPATFEARELKRGFDGWTAWKGPDGQYMIGLEWDQPRDVAVAEIEFRHAIADRDKIKVQYFLGRRRADPLGRGATVSDLFHGEWVNVEGEWWAGDRDVGYAFGPCNQEHPGKSDSPALRYRRTYRLRFLLGHRDEPPPPVRYIRVYGPAAPAESSFEVKLDPLSSLHAPLEASVINGLIVEEKTTTQTATLEAEPIRLRVRYAEGDTENPNRTVVTLRCEGNATQGISFLPAQVVRDGTIHVPALGATISHVGGQPGSRPASRGEATVDPVLPEPEQTWERAREEIAGPRKWSDESASLYLPLGPPDARQEITVAPDGSILLDKSALKVPAEDSEQLDWPADKWTIRLDPGEFTADAVREGGIRQSWLDGFLPVLTNAWEKLGVGCRQTCVATFLHPPQGEARGDECVVLISRLEITNTSSQPASALMRLAIEPREVLSAEDGHIYAMAATSEERRHRFFLKATGSGSMTPRIPAGDPHAVEWQLDLKSGQKATIEWRVPFMTLRRSADRARLAALDFDAVVRDETDRWQALVVKAASFDVPEPLLNDFYRAQLVHLLITADRDPHNGMRVLPAATFELGVQLTDACRQIRSLEVWGRHDEAAEYLEAILDSQSSRKPEGRYTNAGGFFQGMPSRHGDYQTSFSNLDHGWVLWTLAEHYRFTRDRRWLARVADKLIAACDAITRQRQVADEAGILASDERSGGPGLLPPGPIEDSGEWFWWYAVNAYAWRGMKGAAEGLIDINDPDAQRVARDAEDFARALRRSCRESMIHAPVVRLLDGDYVPHQPSRYKSLGWIPDWKGEMQYGPAHLIDCGVYEPDSPEARWILRKTEDEALIDRSDGGERSRAVRALYNGLAAHMYDDVRTVTGNDNTGRRAPGPFYRPGEGAALAVVFRHLLVAENGDKLDLLAGVPQAWLEPGQRIAVRGAATWFGPLDLEVESLANPRRLVIRLDGPRRNPPVAIRLHLRTGERIVSATLNGERLSTFVPAAGIITLPGDVGRANLTIFF